MLCYTFSQSQNENENNQNCQLQRNVKHFRISRFRIWGLSETMSLPGLLFLNALLGYQPRRLWFMAELDTGSLTTVLMNTFKDWWRISHATLRNVFSKDRRSRHAGKIESVVGKGIGARYQRITTWGPGWSEDPEVRPSSRVRLVCNSRLRLKPQAAVHELDWRQQKIQVWKPALSVLCLPLPECSAARWGGAFPHHTFHRGRIA